MFIFANKRANYLFFSYYFLFDERNISKGKWENLGIFGTNLGILNFIKGSKGKWVDANNFCKSEKESEINDEELNQLIIYCSKK